RDKLLRMEGGGQLPAAHQPNAMQAARGQQIVHLARTLRCKSDARVKYRQIAMGKHPRRNIRRGPLPELERKLVGMATKQEDGDVLGREAEPRDRESRQSTFREHYR